MMDVSWLVILAAQAGGPARTLASDAGGWTTGFTRLGAIACGLAIGVLAIWCLSRRTAPHQQRAPHSPQLLLRELCRAHRLSAAQERLLEWVVSDQQPREPALVFLDPLLLERSIARCNTPGVRRRLADLRARLFAGMDPGGESSAA